MTKVEGVIEKSATPEVRSTKRQKVPEVQKEPDMASGQSATSLQEQMELVLQNPQQCTELMQLCLAKNISATFPAINIEVETCTRTIYRRGGGGDTFRAFNDQWTPTVGPSTQGGHPFFC
jgi:hypothetical protein